MQLEIDDIGTVRYWDILIFKFQKLELISNVFYDVELLCAAAELYANISKVYIIF